MKTRTQPNTCLNERLARLQKNTARKKKIAKPESFVSKKPNFAVVIKEFGELEVVKGGKASLLTTRGRWRGDLAKGAKKKKGGLPDAEKRRRRGRRKKRKCKKKIKKRKRRREKGDLEAEGTRL